MSLTTSKTIYRAGFGPLLSGVFVAPFPYCFRCTSKKDANQCCYVPLKELEMLLVGQTSPEETAAFLIEPILGEGGYVPPPPGFFRSFCK